MMKVTTDDVFLPLHLRSLEVNFYFCVFMQATDDSHLLQMQNGTISSICSNKAAFTAKMIQYSSMTRKRSNRIATTGERITNYSRMFLAISACKKQPIRSLQLELQFYYA